MKTTRSRKLPFAEGARCGDPLCSRKADALFSVNLSYVHKGKPLAVYFCSPEHRDRIRRVYRAGGVLHEDETP